MYSENDAFVMYFKFLTPFLTTKRDLTLTNKWEITDNKIYTGSKSCSYPYPLENDVIRADTYIVGFILEKID